jgi:superfamily II DNA or RNA helicase
VFKTGLISHFLNYSSYFNVVILKDLFKTINSWSDFISKLESLNKKEKGDAFELLTELYFKLSPKYSFYDEVWMLSEVPVSVIEELGIPSHDLGIDLIAKNGNEYHAIQCKYHSDKNQSVTFKEVSTFISLLESNHKFTQGYICSSADITSRNYNKLNTKPINLVLSDSWQELEKEFFENVRSYLSKKKVSLVPFEPRDHQKKALSEALEYFVKEENSRGKLIFPCGAGKSLTGFWMLQKLQSKSTLIAVPSLSLVKQTLDVYLREIVAHKRKVKWLCICSDEGIGQDDDVVFYTENLGVPCQTDPEYIEQWLRENQDEEIIIFTTYQSGRIIGEISKKLNYSFDLGIFDEAHKTVGSDKKLFSHLLFEQNISIQKRIFMTATERFYRGSKDDIISMDDYDIYGDTFTQMSFKEAIELGLLTDYKVITIDVKKSEIADFIKQNNLVQLNNKWKKETEARSLASMLALRKAMKQFPIKNAVSFHSSIEKAIRNKELQNHITDTYNYEPIDTYTVSGKLPTSKRKVIVQEFARSPKSLITNARCLTEGVDVPNIDCIVFSDPRKSKVDIVQALGRALRKKEGKDWGYVILPVIYDEETYEIDNDNFQEILSIVRGLASNDERIVEFFKDKAEQGSSKKPSGRQFQLEVFSEFVNELELSNQLQIRLWEKLSRFNWMSFEEAKNYVLQNEINTSEKWRQFVHSSKRPNNLPTLPNLVYKESGWISWGDFFGTNRIANQLKTFLSYDEAREILILRGIKSHKKLREFLKSDERPSNFPGNPKHNYLNKGWVSWEHFFDIEKSEFLVFDEAKKIIHSLNLKNRDEWREYCKSDKKPNNIPANPDTVYKKDGWINMGDWLGTGNLSNRDKKFRPFKEARQFVHSLNLNNIEEWLTYAKSPHMPSDIPTYPGKPYKKNGWINWADWLGKNTFQGNSKKLTFEEAREFVRNLNLKSTKEWANYCGSGNKPSVIPNRPSAVYKDNGWQGWGDWLGTGTIAHFNKQFFSFQELKLIVQNNNIKSQSEWHNYYKNLVDKSNIPSNPQSTFKDKGWVNWADFLGKTKK